LSPADQGGMMSELKTQPTQESVLDFLAKVSDGRRREDCLIILELMKKATGAEPVMWGSSIVGFGRYRYRYESGREGEWPIVGFSPRKNDLTLYITPGFERYKGLMGRLGKYKTGKSCLYLKRLEDVDRSVLNELIEESVKTMAPMRVDI
jgi:hypothetical protein